MSRFAGIACGAVAVVVCAWFVIGIRQAHDTERAQAIVSSARSISNAQADRAGSLLSSARTLNPDREVDILQAQADLERGETQRARRILFAVTRAEPQNVEAWLWLAKASSDDPNLFLRVVARARKLEPIVPSAG